MISITRVLGTSQVSDRYSFIATLINRIMLTILKVNNMYMPFFGNSKANERNVNSKMRKTYTT
nr:hypothetical protein Q903MT_gene991 [Picea sitchensis]